MKARYKAVVDRYAQAIRSGQLPAGSRLPTHRTLAAGERISLATATRVYRELEEMGLVSGETGRGTFVRDLSLPPGHGVDQQVVAADVVDLNFNYPSLPEQGDALREALRQLAMAGDIDSHLRYQPHAGRLAERDIIVRHLTCQHFAPDAENVLIVNGAQHGLAVTVMGLLRPGGCGGGGCADLFGLQNSGGAVSSGAGGDPLSAGGTGPAGASDAVPAAAGAGGVYHADAAQSAGLGAQHRSAAGAGRSCAPARSADY